jgi:hypothetical protein
VPAAWKKVKVNEGDQLTVDLTIDPAKMGSIVVTLPDEEANAKLSLINSSLFLIPIEFDRSEMWLRPAFEAGDVEVGNKSVARKGVPAGEYLALRGKSEAEVEVAGKIATFDFSKRGRTAAWAPNRPSSAMFFEIAERTADRLVVRRYWDGKGQGLQMLIQGIVYVVAGIVFSIASMSGGPWLVRLLFGSFPLLGVFFIWWSRRQSRRIEEGLYVFDKRRGVFELSHRTENGFTRSESYPLERVRGAIADDIGNEGYAARLVIVLSDNQVASLNNWTTFVRGDAERASQAINEFLGIVAPAGRHDRCG